MGKNIKIISSEEFPRQFMSDASQDFDFLKTPLQIYDLNTTTEYLQIPTPLFRPDYNFIVHVTKGNAKQQVDNEVITITENDVLFVKQGHITAMKEIDQIITGHFILFEESVLNHILSKQELIQIFATNSVLKLPEETSVWLNSLFCLLSQEFRNENSNIEICYSLMQAAFQKIIFSNKELNKTVHRGNEITFSFKELVYKYHTENKSVTFYADKLKISVNYLNRCIKLTTGIAPKEWINNVSILQSQILLQDLTKDISEIAFALNYEDPSYFGRLFKKITGTTPSQYRNSLTHDLSE
ncbi:AraC family transcriptional regulator [Flavobacterium sp. Fl-318]|uniref:AraC family transcriptional regulator n=1 Tax=Flavobacterium cupriresistens TaxID=2893885 RepID=A0ABU4R650_9FLAO|nr:MULTISPECIES: AraC family transcriptional regulator [unclassified Flavobacterium]MDX6188054.1 AraC family transcriptional regulator [Flavobacterium sp. Fl-318]UFH42026.1 AraC family transcriptional regulator [Flavobacterium sp. F-323]